MNLVKLIGVPIYGGRRHYLNRMSNKDPWFIEKSVQPLVKNVSIFILFLLILNRFIC